MSDTAQNNFFVFPKIGFVFSISLHVVAFWYLAHSRVLKNAISEMSKEEKEKLKWTEQLYQESIQVDMVALPDQMISQTIDATHPIATRPGEKEMDYYNKGSTAADLKAAEDAMAMVDKKKEQADRDKALKDLKADHEREEALHKLTEQAEEGGRKKLKGNKLAKGVSSKGAIMAMKDSYRALLKRTIEKKIEFRIWHKGKGLKAKIALEITPKGRARSVVFVEKSADQTFDDEVIKAIEKAQPFPVPEELSILTSPFPIILKPEE